MMTRKSLVLFGVCAAGTLVSYIQHWTEAGLFLFGMCVVIVVAFYDL